MRLELEIEEVNKILIVLSKMPYDEVFSLISKIHSQGSEQLETKEQDDLNEE